MYAKSFDVQYVTTICLSSMTNQVSDIDYFAAYFGCSVGESLRDWVHHIYKVIIHCNNVAQNINGILFSVISSNLSGLQDYVCNNLSVLFPDDRLL